MKASSVGTVCVIALLACAPGRTVQGKVPGRALDYAMGDGRNARQGTRTYIGDSDCRAPLQKQIVAKINEMNQFQADLERSRTLLIAPGIDITAEVVAAFDEACAVR